jgi:hypothetical protein
VFLFNQEVSMSDNTGGSTDTGAEENVGVDTHTDTDTDSSADGDSNDNNDAEVSAKEEGGSITTDEQSRFLSEIAAFHGFSSVVTQVTKKLKAKIGQETKRILLVDDLNLAAKEIVTRDMQAKFEVFDKLMDEILEQCHPFAVTAKEPDIFLVDDSDAAGWGDDKDVDKEKGKQAAHIFGFDLTGIAPALEVWRELLSALSDVLGYFKVDTDIKGQTVQSVSVPYVQSLVAGKLIDEGYDVSLVNFNFITKSSIIKSINALVLKHQQMFNCTETLSKQLAEKTARVTEINDQLKALRDKLIEIVGSNEAKVITTLRAEISAVELQLEKANDGRPSDEQISKLENYLESLREKQLEELTSDHQKALETLEQKIKIIVEKLAANDAAPPDKKLPAAEASALQAQLTLLQKELVVLLKKAGYDARAALEKEISRATNQLSRLQKERMPGSQITLLETHLGKLQAQLESHLIKTDNAAMQRILASTEELKALRDQIQENSAQLGGLVSGSAKITEAFKAFLTGIITPPADGKYAPLVISCIQEQTQQKDYDFFLHIKHAHAGADFVMETSKLIIRPRASCIGGGVLTYFMADKTGRLAASGTVADYAVVDYRFRWQPAWLQVMVRNNE